MTTGAKLFALMVLELFIWGAWFPVVFDYLPSLGFTASQVTWTVNAFHLASIVAVLFSGPFVDRHFAAERFLAFSHLVGGGAMVALAFTRDFAPFFWLMLLHSVLYVPTISVANSIAFAHMRDAKKEFGLIRMGGTLGWILAAWPLFFILYGKSGPEAVPLKANVFLAAGIVSLLLAAFSLTLPHTPPRTQQGRGVALLDTVTLLRLPYVLVLVLVTFVDAAVHQGYFVLTDSFLRSARVGIADHWVMPVMSLGQVAEIGTMAMLGVVLKRLGWRRTMFLGVLGHALRFAIFAYCPDQLWLIVGANLLHGICYAFFFATVYIFVDEFFPKDTRATAQSLFNVLILGVGPIAGNSVWLGLKGKHTVNNVTDYGAVFPVLALTALGAALYLLVFFRPPAGDGQR